MACALHGRVICPPLINAAAAPVPSPPPMQAARCAAQAPPASRRLRPANVGGPQVHAPVSEPTIACPVGCMLLQRRVGWWRAERAAQQHPIPRGAPALRRRRRCENFVATGRCDRERCYFAHDVETQRAAK